MIVDKETAIYLSEVSIKSFDKNGDCYDLLNRKIISSALDGRLSNQIYIGEIYRILDPNKNCLDKDFVSNVSDQKTKDDLDKAYEILNELNNILVKLSYRTNLVDNCLIFHWD